MIEKSLDDDKAENIVSVDLAGKSDIADFMVIATGRSSRHVVSLADNLVKRIKQLGSFSPAIEGQEQGDWVLVDAGDVIVHLFRPDIRTLYGLEKMWTAPSEATPVSVRVA